LDRSFVRILGSVTLREPVFVDLTAFQGSPVQSTGQILIEKSRADKIGELYSPYFEDYVTVASSGLSSLPKIEFHASSNVTPNLLILTGEQNADPNDVYANYEIAETVLDYSVAQGCKTFVSCTVFRSRRAKDAVYVASATSSEASVLAERLGVKTFGFGRIVSQMGPLLGLAKARGFRVISILGPLKSSPEDETLPGILLDVLAEALELKLI
jgi:proteasome assembly chaperone (PAC2) family protein